MTAWISLAARELFRREMLSARVRWWFVAEGMCQWYRLLRDELAQHLGGRAPAEAILARIAAPMLARRYDLLRGEGGARFPELPDRASEPRAVGLVMGALHRVASNVGETWVFAEVGGAPSGFSDHARAERWIAPISLEARWDEITHHLGELLIALTERLPDHMPRARGVLGDLCFSAGLRYGRKMRKAFSLEGSVAEALEMLRMSEYVFQVNPQHWGGSREEERAGYLEGTACPWFSAPGWNGAHCGIFGQFQSGISAAFGLRYHLTTTIPKHGGHTCKIDVRPISGAAAIAAQPIGIRRGREGAEVKLP